ncbi:DUF6701 domain-containing protein [Roseateles sp.]|uniref:DUF6701 domain-containing protein n=1 Tax=Roseateles sp. TaxID=1971397 RepID=UPI0025DC15B6|nr:DUF6701 domain-containing protein [Roseateles sp.]MBV8035718.1 hypothetical protein [Roseateles sp.]
MKSSALLVFLGLLLVATLSRAAPSYVGASTQAQSSPTNLISLTPPPGLAAGDMMLAVLVQRTGSVPLDQNMISVPTGWVLVRSQDDGINNSIGLSIYRKQATASEPASYDWKLGSTGRAAGAALAFRGVDTTTPIDASASQSNAASATYTAPSVLTSTASALLVAVHTAVNGNGSVATPSGMTQAVNIGTSAGPNGLVLGTSYAAQAGAGASGSKQSSGNAVLASLGVLVALRSGGPSSSTDHYELSLPTSSLTCLPTTLTVKACANASSPCTSVDTTVNGSAGLSSSAGTLAGSVVSFSNGVATTTLSLPAGADGTAVAVTLSGETVPAANGRQCCPNGGSCSAANSCTTTFNRAGFIISASAGGGVASLPTQTAGTASSGLFLRAVRSNTTTQACEPALSGSRSVNWAYQCNDPSTCSGGNLMSVNAGLPTTVQRNAAAAALAYSAVAMTFDANGNAPFTLNFADVGRTTLYFNTTINGDPLSGASNAFVTRPGGFTVDSVSNAAAAPNPAAAGPGDAVFTQAGAPFGARITAVTSGGVATPNFGRENTPEGVLLTPGLVQPAGGATGTLGNATLAGGQFSGGSASVANLSYSEVGIMQITASTASSAGYLGSGSVTGTPSANVGRFVPAGFVTSGFAVTQRSDLGCKPASDFSYLGENFVVAFTLTALNTAGATTQNYTGSFAKLAVATPVNLNLAGVAGATSFKGAGLPTSAGSGSWSSGVANVRLTANAVRGTSPGGPFDTAQFGIAPVDGDGVGMLALNLATSPPSTTVDRSLLGQVRLRYGRLRLQNGMSAPNRALTLPLTAQYWDSGLAAYRTNTLDSCTSVSAANLSFGNFRPKPLGVSMNPASVTVDPVNGSFITLTQSSGARLSVDVAIALDAASPPPDQSCLAKAGWAPTTPATQGANLASLRGNWCGASNDPGARASWGLYRGSDGVLYQRENF